MDLAQRGGAVALPARACTPLLTAALFAMSSSRLVANVAMAPRSGRGAFCKSYGRDGSQHFKVQVGCRVGNTKPLQQLPVRCPRSTSV